MYSKIQNNMEKDYYKIGSHREIEGGTIYEAGSTDNGFCYKSEKAIRETVKNRIESYDFACFDDKVILNSKEMWDMYQEFIDRLTEGVLESVDWQDVDVLINEWNMDEELDSFLQEKFTEFAKARLEKDGDDTEYEDNDDLWDKLSNYLGCYCYRDDNYSLTDWDSLIDRWENEPNY